MENWYWIVTDDEDQEELFEGKLTKKELERMIEELERYARILVYQLEVLQGPMIHQTDPLALSNTDSTPPSEIGGVAHV